MHFTLILPPDAECQMKSFIAAPQKPYVCCNTLLIDIVQYLMFLFNKVVKNQIVQFYSNNEIRKMDGSKDFHSLRIASSRVQCNSFSINHCSFACTTQYHRSVSIEWFLRYFFFYFFHSIFASLCILCANIKLFPSSNETNIMAMF